MDYTIIHHPEWNRFEYHQDGYTAYAKYVMGRDTLDILHVIVPVVLEGKGIAAALVKKTYDYALEQGLQPRATCPYAVAWLHRHPEYTEEK